MIDGGGKRMKLKMEVVISVNFLLALAILRSRDLAS